MSRQYRILLFLLALAVALAGWHRFGRSIWHSNLERIRGEETVTSVLEKATSKGLGLTENERARVRALTIIALKDERRVESWGHDDSGNRELLRNYPFLGYSGRLGPKLREGDGQIPEGIYRVDYLNPNSDYHLSFKIDYPNAFDRVKGRLEGRDRLGFDIFIHGKTATVGCIPIGDEAIEDLFTIVAQAGRENVAVIIAPWDFRLRDDHPNIEGIEWEEELYASLREAMDPFPKASRLTPADAP